MACSKSRCPLRRPPRGAGSRSPKAPGSSRVTWPSPPKEPSSGGLGPRLTFSLNSFRVACVDCWIFRKDVAKNNVPTLILHGDADRILPPDATSRRQVRMIKNVKFVELPGGPHGVLWTHADHINSELVSFLA